MVRENRVKLSLNVLETRVGICCCLPHCRPWRSIANGHRDSVGQEVSDIPGSGVDFYTDSSDILCCTFDKPVPDCVLSMASSSDLTTMDIEPLSAAYCEQYGRDLYNEALIKSMYTYFLVLTRFHWHGHSGTAEVQPLAHSDAIAITSILCCHNIVTGVIIVSVKGLANI